MSSKALDTPPSRDIETAAPLPPSPPLSPKKRTSLSAVDRLIGTLRLRKAGRLDSGDSSGWRTFKLSGAEYSQLQQRVRQDQALWGWYEDKVRYDWDPEEETYTLRMPTTLHERFIALVEDAIVARISGLAEKLGRSDRDGADMVAGELRQVFRGGSPTLKLRVPKLENSSHESAASDEEEQPRLPERSPDATFYHPSHPDFPCLVLEVSYSQQRKNLPRLAESYIVDSQHAIRCVVGLDFIYPSRGKNKQDGRATVSVWRPGVETDEEGEEVGVCRQDVDGLAFRAEGGEACEGALDLSARDLLPSALLSDTPTLQATENLTIPFPALSSYLSTAEAQITARPSFASNTSSASGPNKFRKRQRTPPEELSDGREAAFQQQEEDAEEKGEEEDDEWKARGQRRRIESGQNVVEVVERRRSVRRRASGRASAGSGS